MLEQLSASRIGGRLQPGRVLLAAAMHGIVIFGAIRATGGNDDRPVGRQIPVIDMVLPPTSTPEPVAPPSDAEAVVAAPAPEDFLTPPVDVPPSIPPIVAGPAFDVSTLRRAPEPGTLIRAVPRSGASDRILAVGEVDEPASVLFQPAPRYPPVLQAAGLEGRVLLEFIIDTAGHPEPASVRIIERSREGFDAAALETLARSLFRPARVAGRTVRQRTLQWVVFRIAP